MTWQAYFWNRLQKRCAAVFAAHFILLAWSTAVALAQDVMFRSEDFAVAIEGRFIGYDGAVVTILTGNGPVSFRADDMTCDGEACPDLEAYVPQVRIIGDRRIGEVLMPALIEVYGRDQEYEIGEGDGIWFLRKGARNVLSMRVDTMSHSQGFEEFLQHRSDILVSMNELTADELQRGFNAGLGRLDSARLARVIALDALVPVVSPSSDLRDISISEMVEILSGEDDSFDVFLADQSDSQLWGFEHRFMAPLGRSLAAPDRVFSDPGEVVRAVSTSERALTLVPFGTLGNAQPLSLSGPCGLQTDARFLSLKTEDYPLTFPVYLYLPDRQLHPEVDSFLDWLRSPAAQIVVRRAGFVDLSAVPIPLEQQGERLANAISRAGPEVSLGELQRLIRLMRPRVRMSSTFRFEPGSTRLDGQSRSNVMQLAQAIRDGRFGGREILFVGFSDGRGPALANRDLSAARAEAVMRNVIQALAGEVPATVMLDTEAFGEAMPMACDDTVWGQQTNRRVELWVRDLP